MSAPFDDDSSPRRFIAVVSIPLVAFIILMFIAVITNNDDDLDLDGTDWQLVQLSVDGELRAPLETSVLTVSFSDGTASGTGGCNNYSTGYTADGSSIEFSPIMTTLAFCDDPPGASEQEASYLALFGSANTVDLTDDRLELGVDGTTTLVFTAP